MRERSRLSSLCSSSGTGMFARRARKRTASGKERFSSSMMKVDDAAAFFAAEAVAQLLVRQHVERRRLFAVKGAAAPQAPAARLERDIIADNVDNIVAGDELVQKTDGQRPWRPPFSLLRTELFCCQWIYTPKMVTFLFFDGKISKKIFLRGENLTDRAISPIISAGIAAQRGRNIVNIRLYAVKIRSTALRSGNGPRSRVFSAT